MINLISNIHWLSVIVLTVFLFMIGFAWHQPFLFGKIRKKENFPNSMPKFNAPLLFGGTAIMHFLAIAGLNAVASGTGAENGLMSCLLISVIWIFPVVSGT